jgi:VCBS repeat-containing protein
VEIKKSIIIGGNKMLKLVSVPLRSLTIFICVFSVLAVIAIPLINVSSTSAAENNAIAGTASAIQDAIDDLGGAPGTIYVKAGEFNLGGIVTLHEGVKIIGAGSDLTIIHTTGSGQGFYIPSGADNCRISSMQMVHPAGTAGNAIKIGSSPSSVANDFVIDNMKFYNYGGDMASVYIKGGSRGLICDSYIYGYPGDGLGYGVVILGDHAYYTDGRYMGSENNVFVERCTFQNCRHCISSDDGAHYVFRYNKCSQNVVGQCVDGHGAYVAGRVGTLSCEVYNNTITNPVSGTEKGILFRGGQTYIYNNNISGYTWGIVYQIEYGSISSVLPYRVHDSYEWGNTNATSSSMVATVSSLNSSSAYIFEGTHYFTDTKPAGYTPYIYPHPLTPGGGASTNNPPVAGDDSYSIEQDSKLNIGNPGVLNNDSDSEGDILSAVLVSDVSHGSLILDADGSFNYTPASGFSGTDTFRYNASDGINSSTMATVTITVSVSVKANTLDKGSFGLDSGNLTSNDPGNSFQAIVSSLMMLHQMAM